MTFKKDAQKDHGRTRPQDVGTMREALEEAVGLAVQIDRLLTSPQCTMAEVDTFRIRLARAHTLSLLDQLSELIGPLESTMRLASRDDDDDDDEGKGASGIRSAWR
jgi:hypothetical protein